MQLREQHDQAQANVFDQEIVRADQRHVGIASSYPSVTRAREIVVMLTVAASIGMPGLRRPITVSE